MPIQRRRRLHSFWPPGYHMGPWHHPMPHYGPPPGWGGWGWGRPTPEEEKEYLDDHIEMLKEELAAAEEYRKELEGSE
ncbi:DUF5320 domain-containing protein [Thiohalomonas denitrificans]|uniref:DUF5320 domain-containing protein n=1 Tax=Thiohalomonas denitrificans TaxID=415747 RepID=UPI0026F0E832|nr:DUF5320 domain-containing protein [Thiohalomonas denitrificans]